MRAGKKKLHLCFDQHLFLYSIIKIRVQLSGDYLVANFKMSGQTILYRELCGK